MQQPTTLERQIANLGHGDHVCMIYEDREQQMAAAVPFIRDGLQRDECCVYIADDLTVDETRVALEEAGIDTERETARGALSLITKREAYLKTGQFDPEEMIQFLRATVDTAVQKGFKGYRVTGEMTWALGCEHGCDRLIEYEARLNNFFPGSRALAICQYNRKRFSPSVIYDILRTHPRAVVGENVCPNLYYERPEAVLQDRGMAEKVDWMLQQLQRAGEAELKVQEFNAELERKVTEKTASLEEAREQLQTFCHTMAHDLRAPLRSIESFAEILIESHAAQLDEEGRSFLMRMQRAARRVQKLVADLLAYANVLGRDMPLNAIELGELLPSVVAEFKETELGRSAQLELQARPVVVAGHEATLRVALANLLNNAAKFVRKGEPPRITVSVEALEKRAQILVADRGIGIAPEHLSQLFVPFQRLHPAEIAYAGSGMGLAIVKTGVERMGGTVGVESAFGKGSRFRLELARAGT